MSAARRNPKEAAGKALARRTETAYKADEGAAGVDRMPADQLRPYLREHWPRIKEELLDGRYKPSPMRAVEIPKPGGKGMRTLGIPTVVDRLIQQAVHMVLTPCF